jgi:hypothetical protein
MGHSSPQVICDPPGDSLAGTTINQTSNSGSPLSFESMEQSGSANHKGDEGVISEYSSDRKHGTILPQNEHIQQPKILVADLMCPTCKHLLIHPVALNCGHGRCSTFFSCL